MGRTSDSKERMLAAARDLIWKRGYCAVTIDAICTEASVRKGSFYYFFDSKSELAEAAFIELWDEFKPELDRIFSTSTAPLNRLRSFFQFLYQRQVALKEKYGCVVGCPFASIGSELSQHEEPVCRNARAILTSFRKYFEAALREAAVEESIKIADIPAAARRLSAYMEGCLLQARVQNDLSFVRDLAANALDFVGIKPSAPRMHTRRNRLNAGMRLLADSSTRLS